MRCSFALTLLFTWAKWCLERLLLIAMQPMGLQSQSNMGPVQAHWSLVLRQVNGPSMQVHRCHEHQLDALGCC